LQQGLLFISGNDLLPHAHERVDWIVVFSVLSGAAIIPIMESLLGIVKMAQSISYIIKKVRALCNLKNLRHGTELLKRVFAKNAKRRP